MSVPNNGLVLMYVRDNNMYPVLLTKEQQETFEIVQQLIPQPIRVLDESIGRAVLIEKPKKINPAATG